MKKAVFLILAALFITFNPAMAFAQEGNGVPIDLTDPETLLPVDVSTSQDGLEIRKVYELPANADPGKIPYAPFEQGHVAYICSDILREVVIGNEYKTVTETETIESKKNDMDTILSLLPEIKEIMTEDGFEGVLHLRASSIESEIAGYGSSSKAVTISRSYPNLSNADLQFIPKTVTEGGRTYTFESVQWQADNTHNINDYEIPSRYTANVVYSATATSSYPNRYTVTAEYTGEVFRTGITKIRYTVIYSGSVMPEPEPEAESLPEMIQQEPVNEAGNLWMNITLIFIAILLAANLVLNVIYIKDKKELRINEKMDDPAIDDEPDVTGTDDDCDGSGA